MCKGNKSDGGWGISGKVSLKRSLSWDLNDEEEKLSAEQRNRGPVTETRLVCETEHIQSDWRADSRGPWQMSPSVETRARPLQATAGVGLLLKAKGGNWRVWTNQRRVVISFTLKDHFGCLVKNRPRAEAGSSVRRCQAKLRQNKTKTETDEYGLDFGTRALSLAEIGWCVNKQWERKKKNPRMPQRAWRHRNKLRASTALADLESQVPVRKHRGSRHLERGPEWNTSYCGVLDSEPAEPGSDLTPF